MIPTLTNRVNAIAGSIDKCHGDEHLNEINETDQAERLDDFWSSESIDDLEKFMGKFGDDAQLMVLLKKACAWPTDSRSPLYETDIINLFEYVRDSVAKGFDDETI